MKNLEKYMKRPKSAKPLEAKVTSVNLDMKHYLFITDNNLNLSEMVRDMLEEEMQAPAPRRKTG